MNKFSDESGYTSSPQKDLAETPPRGTYPAALLKSASAVSPCSSTSATSVPNYVVSPFGRVGAGQMSSSSAVNPVSIPNPALPNIGFSFLTPGLMPGFSQPTWLNTLRIMQLNAMNASFQQQQIKQSSQAEPLDLSKSTQSHSKRQKVLSPQLTINFRYRLFS